ncbi:MAG: chemotaxis-specific protein-glutamate methyltransferase CheB [Pseudomonadota bacterium]
MTDGSDIPRNVVIVDDSRTIRALLRATIDADPRFTVVGEAGDPYEAREVIKRTNPDIITLDVEMPRMNGLVFLEHLMRLRPMPVVMVSSRTREHSVDAVRALALGAIDCVDRARLQSDPLQRTRFLDALYSASNATIAPRPATQAGARAPAPLGGFRWNGRIVLIGSSTGGVDALERVFCHFPENAPPTIVAQHMPGPFLASFAARLNVRMRPKVCLATDESRMEQGQILIAPGGEHHATLAGLAPGRVALLQGDGTDLYVPSVDVLFRSAKPLAERVLAVMLTGMGRDGAEAMADLRTLGARTLAQSGETSVVDGMPRAARNAGAVERNVPLDRLGAEILAMCSKSPVGERNA